MKILIVRDRESAGGGIFNYYRSISPHLPIEHQFVDVGQPHPHFGGTSSALFRVTPFRLMVEWATVFVKCVLFRPDIVHVNPGMDATKCRALTRDAVTVGIARILCRRVLVFWRGWEGSWVGAQEFPHGNSSLLARIYRTADAHIVLASRFKEDLVRWGFKCPIHVETTVASDECLKPQAVEECDSEGIHLLFLSRIEERKGVFELVEAFRILSGRGPRYTLTIAGDGPHLEELRAFARGLSPEAIRFPGYLTGAAKAACYRSASMFCFPSAHGEGMPNAVLEAMAMGLPIVASGVGGLQDILQEGVTGAMLVQRGDTPRRCFDPTEMADVIESLAKDDALRQRISHHNAGYARVRFAAPVVARRLEAIYESVVFNGAASQSDVRANDVSSSGD